MYSNRVQSVVLRWESFQGINLYIVVVSKKTINKNAQQWDAGLHIHREKLYFCRRDTFKSTAMDNLEKRKIMHFQSVPFGQMRQNWMSLATKPFLMFGKRRLRCKRTWWWQYYAVGILQCI